MDAATENITFTRKYNLQSGRIDQVSMREPTTADIRNAILASQKYQGDVDMRDIVKEQSLLVHLTSLTPCDLDQLAACDYERLQIGLLILRADPNNRSKLRKEYAVGEKMPSDSSSVMLEGVSTLSEQ